MILLTTMTQHTLPTEKHCCGRRQDRDGGWFGSLRHNTRALALVPIIGVCRHETRGALVSGWVVSSFSTHQGRLN